MLRKLYILFFALLLTSNARALEAVQSHSLFYLPDPVYAGALNPYVEAYWQINPRTVHFNTTAEKMIIARIQTDVRITNDTGKVIKDDHYVYQTKPVATPGDLELLNIIELKRYLVTKGKMKMVITLTDLNDPNNKLVLTDTFTAPVTDKQPFFATPELVDTIYDADVKTPFRKHARQYMPMCVPFFDDYKQTLSYYTELYYSDQINKDDYPLIRNIFISKKEFESPFTKYTRIDTLNSLDTTYVSGTFSINNLPSGNYYLNVMLGNKYHRTLSAKSIFFQRVNTHKTADDLAVTKATVDTGLENVTFLNLSKTFVAKYDIGQMKAILKMLIPVSDAMGIQAIEGFLKKPDDVYMRYFIYNHFLSINKKDPGKAWKEFTEEVKEVNKMYNTGTTPGYETARGMMYMRYGAPTEIITVENEAGTLPYEIWQYNALTEKSGKNNNNAIMLFYKANETSFNFNLLHTTIHGELYNPLWRQYLYLDPNAGTNLNSRAEQYLGENK